MYCLLLCTFSFFFFKQKTAYEMRISDWSSDVCSSDLIGIDRQRHLHYRDVGVRAQITQRHPRAVVEAAARIDASVEARGLEQAGDVDRQRRIAGRLEIGSASCRERVCQYV